MEPTMSIPKAWKYPRFMLNQQTDKGLINGMVYTPKITPLGNIIGYNWQYSVLTNDTPYLRLFDEEELQESNNRKINLYQTTFQEFNQRESNLCKLLIQFESIIVKIVVAPEYKALLEEGYQLDDDIINIQYEVRKLYLKIILSCLD